MRKPLVALAATAALLAAVWSGAGAQTAPSDDDTLAAVCSQLDASPRWQCTRETTTTTTTEPPTTTTTVVASTTTTVPATTTTPAPTTTVPASTTTAAPQTVGQLYGGYATPIGAYQTVAYNTNDFRAAHQTGMSWLRVDAPVKTVMPTATTRNWQALWNWVDTAVQQGLRPMVNWYILPQWMNGSTDDKTQPTSAQVYADSLREAAPLMWAHGVKAIELWNEPNLSGFWKPTPDRAYYVQVALAAARAIKSVTPDMLVVTGGVSTADTEYGAGTHKTVTRFDTGASYTSPELGANQTLDIYGALGLFAAKQTNGAPLIDGVGIHPYLDDYNPNVDTTDGNWMRWQPTPMRRTLAIIDRWQGQALKVWNTESAAPRSLMSDTEQASRAGAAFSAFNRWTLASGTPMRTRLGPYFYFTYTDWTAASEPRARTFGLVFPDYTDHPARPAVAGVLDDPTT